MFVIIIYYYLCDTTGMQ